MTSDIDQRSATILEVGIPNQRTNTSPWVTTFGHGLGSKYLSSKFERREIAYNLKDSENKLNVSLHTSYCKNSFSYSGASLPRDLREAESLRQFKRLLNRDV